jgi:protoheme IX farnesyltransferase
MYNMSVRAKAGVEQGSEARPMRVFHASITYLTLVFLAVAIDPLLPF